EQEEAGEDCDEAEADHRFPSERMRFVHITYNLAPLRDNRFEERATRSHALSHENVFLFSNTL
ncbi:MAG TPA: hypothetical protein VHN82_03615, partial [Methanoregula sp.]|nr:hypothetical protein [Methanoregula sp.]